MISFCGYVSSVFMSLPDDTLWLQLAVRSVDLFIITISSILLIYWLLAMAKLLAKVKSERDSSLLSPVLN